MRSVLRHLDVDALAAGVRTESRARQRHLPPVSVFRWWARRAETITGAVVDAVAADAVRPGSLLVADPFAGGGVIALAALIRGHRVYAQDINPWAARSLTTMLTLPDPAALDAAAGRLRHGVARLLADAYATTLRDGTPAHVTHTLRVATGSCPTCETLLRLFPTALVSLTSRVDAGGRRGWMACRAGHLQQVPDTSKRGSCTTCRRYILPTAVYTPGRVVTCYTCGHPARTDELTGPNGFSWQVALVERAGEGRREIGPPSAAELTAANDRRWHPKRALPTIEDGIETTVLRRHGITTWHDLYPARQRTVIEALLDRCDEAGGEASVAAALRAAVIGSVEMAGYASRWDARYLKSYEAIANHRYNVTTLAAEPNVWGAGEFGRGTVERRLTHLAKASTWLNERCGSLTVEGPRPTSSRRSRLAGSTDVRVVEGSSRRLLIPTGHLDAVITDPPYADDVHYSELSDLFRAWAAVPTGRLDGDAIVRRMRGPDGMDAYKQLLAGVFTEIHRALRPGGHLVLSFANREPSAWTALFAALQDAGFVAVGYQVVASENETDHAKAGKRACTLDVLLDLVHASNKPVNQYCPEPRRLQSAEATYCHLIGKQALAIGELEPSWSEAFVQGLKATAFLAKPVAVTG
jgi:hypothetical protein